MQRIRLLIILAVAGLLSSASVRALGPVDCGSYVLHGEVRLEKGKAYLVVHRESLSELRLKLVPAKIGKRVNFDVVYSVKSFAGALIKATGSIARAPENGRGEFELEAFERASPLSVREGSGDAIRLLTKRSCKSGE